MKTWMAVGCGAVIGVAGCVGAAWWYLRNAMR